MEVRLLGELEFVGESGLVAVAGKPGGVLALLALAHGRPLSADVLIERVWSAEAPPTARASLQMHVTRLRRLIGPELIVSSANGYALSVPAEAIDSVRFERSTRDGLAAVARGEPEVALALLGGALALWRGGPLLDFRYEDWALPEIARLEELHQACLEAQVEARIAVGRHAEVVGELAGLIERFPHHEGFRRQHMLALYRSGRQADALEAYQAARRLMSDELGIDPSRELVDLERAILQQDASLAAPDQPGAFVPARRPPLPMPATALVGRRREVEEIAEILTGGEARVVTLTGVGGIGKTRLGLAVAREVEDRYAGGAWFVSLVATDDVTLVVPTIAQALGLGSGDAPASTGELATAIAEHELLLVLDNFEHVLPAARYVSELLSAAPRLTVLVTSQSVLRLRGERQYRVAPLELPAAGDDAVRVAANPAVELFVSRARRASSSFRLEVEAVATVAEICRRLDGIPLALELAAARVKLLAPQAILDRLGRRLDLLTSGDRDAPERQRTLRDAIAWSYELLPGPAQELFAALGVFVDGFDLTGAEAVTGITPALDALELLVDSSLVGLQPDEPGRFSMLETLREFALEMLVASREYEAVARAHAAYFAEFAEGLEPLFTGGHPPAALAALEREGGNLRGALRFALEHSDRALGARLAGTLDLLWERRDDSIAMLVSEVRRMGET
jgi:predicted ATPase/DNA-binding SARP family transcriptional activator